MHPTPQRENWNSHPRHAGDLFRATQTRGDKHLRAVCQLRTHTFGREVRLEISGDLQGSGMFRSHDEVLAGGETWKAAMVVKGWR